jgi:hypothetical protein
VPRFPLLQVCALGLAMAASGCRERKESSNAATPALRGPDSRPWETFDPGEELADRPALLNLRGLNEAAAGDGGFIQARDGKLLHSATGQAVRFWGVNGPPAGVSGPALRRVARFLARRGVNLVRIHAPYFDDRGEVDMARVLHTIEVVEAMKAEGIYSHLSVYFPLWFRPPRGTPWLDGYDGKTVPFGALFFNREFQAQYRGWWRALLLTPSPTTGKTLVQEPALAGVEIQNEDSLLFWTFASGRVPDAQMRILERRFADWLAARHGSLAGALEAWGGKPLPRDSTEERRVAIRPLRAIVKERHPRDVETASFLSDVQASFYRETHAFLRSAGFRGFVVASNWTTASPTYLDPLEVLGYLEGDVVDHHGYFGCRLEGKDAEWALRPGQTWLDRRALRFDGEEASGPKRFTNPVVSPSFDGRPSMISETTWPLPNRFRSEAPLFLATYGSLQGVSAIAHFAFEGDRWTPVPGAVMQPWPLSSPAMMGQFPAAALIFRRELVRRGRVLAEIQLSRSDLHALRGSPLGREADLDELRRSPGGDLQAEGRAMPLDPLAFFAGIVSVLHVDGPGSMKVADLRPWVDRDAQRVTSSTGEIRLDYGRGLLVIDAPAAQGASGRLDGSTPIRTHDLEISVGLDNAHVVAVSLDGSPLASARRILLQVMSEERPARSRSIEVARGRRRIEEVGGAPWEIRPLTGTVEFTRPDAGQVAVRALDGNGVTGRWIGNATRIALEPGTIYYLLEAPPAPARSVKTGTR